MKIEEINNRLESYGLNPLAWNIDSITNDKVFLTSNNGKDSIGLDFGIIVPEPPKKSILGRPKK